MPSAGVRCESVQRLQDREGQRRGCEGGHRPAKRPGGRRQRTCASRGKHSDHPRPDEQEDHDFRQDGFRPKSADCREAYPCRLPAYDRERIVQRVAPFDHRRHDQHATEGRVFQQNGPVTENRSACLSGAGGRGGKSRQMERGETANGEQAAAEPDDDRQAGETRAPATQRRADDEGGGAGRPRHPVLEPCGGPSLALVCGSRGQRIGQWNDRREGRGLKQRYGQRSRRGRAPVDSRSRRRQPSSNTGTG